MTASIKPTFQGELMLAGWSETHNGGAKVTFWLPSAEELDVFRRMTVKKGNHAGQRLACVLVEIEEDESPVQDTQRGAGSASRAEGMGANTRDPSIAPDPRHRGPMLARLLHERGVFFDRTLWLEMHHNGFWTLGQHKDHIQELPCIFSAPTRLIELAVNGDRPLRCEGQVCAHHCDGAELPAAGRLLQSDAPQKPPHWYTVPLCHAHHTHWAHGSGKGGASREDKRKLIEHAAHLTAAAVKAAIKEALGLASLAEVVPERLYEFGHKIGYRFPELKA